MAPDHLLPIAPQGPTQQYLSPPQPLPTTGLNAAGNRVHYPPSPYMAKHQEYSTIPLNDQTPISGRSSPMPTPVSGQSTPNGTGNKKKHWSFLPMHSTPSSLEAGENINEKQKKRPKSSRNNSWDLLGDRAEWDEFNPAQASVENLRYAEGDVGTNKLSRLYYWALNRGIVVRWALYILPILALLWLPGILGVTAEKNATIWHIKLIWWSIWATVVWVGFWVSTAVFLMLPSIWRNTVGSIIPTARAYTDVVRNLGFYAKLIAWTLANWISFTPLLINHYTGDQSATSRNDLTTFANVLFGIFLCTIVLAVEKLIIQLIALQFHRDSYEDRLKEQKMNVRCLTTLYINSHDIPGRMDTLTDGASGSTGRTRATKIPQIAIRKALRGLKSAAQNTTTALGNVASEMAGQSVLQTNSPANKVTAALSSANKSRALARRIFYSYRQGGADHLDISDIARYFPDLETAQAAFSIFDKDGNGDATRDEIDASVLGMHRERLSLEASMRDLDGAVRRLDDIFMVVVVAISILILAATITTKLTTLVTSAGTFILGLSWLIGSTMQEILGACIFLFVKHPYDVGDRVDIDGSAYTVVKMNLMSTSFKRVDGKYVWIGHNILTTKVIENVRRSGATSESFIFEVDFETSFETLQELRGRMLRFVKDNSRDFQPVFDVTVDDIPAQGKMVLKADIRYKSNWQQGALKVQRRNKWVCALKMTLKDLKIWGPGGAGDPSPPPPDPVKYTLVPYEPTQPSVQPESPPPTFQTATAAHHATSLTGRREVINDPSQDIWDEEDELGSASRPGTPGPNTPVTDSGMRQRLPPVQVTDGSIEMTSAPVARR
ncbi:serine/threonine protein kinase [Tremella mesenterica]|uniref:Mechanosensitive ion channel protein n=1 Tax=Tremella mesenterica TaxID=5217 RepID=A0A4Q1BR09_TREME|nr:serine/threonine protein kinase [Tremella mesenterica]